MAYDAEYEARKAQYLADARLLQSGAAPQDQGFYTPEMRQRFIARDLAITEAKQASPIDARTLDANQYAAAKAALLKR